MSGESGSSNHFLEEMAALHELKTKLQTTHDQAVETGDPQIDAEADRLQQEIHDRMKALRGEMNPYERGEMKLREQYSEQIAMLAELKKADGTPILETWNSGEHAGKQGIVAIDGKRKPIPTYEDVVKRLLNKETRELIGRKIEQGFTKLSLVPFGVSLADLTAAYRGQLQEHFAGNNDPQSSKKLFYTNTEGKEPNKEEDKITAEQFDTNNPLYVWDKYNNADVDGSLVYHPKKFTDRNDPNHGGKTKTQIIDEGGAWQIELALDLPNIPRKGQSGPAKGGRPLIDTAGSGIEPYILEKNQDGSFKNPSAVEYLVAEQGETAKDASPYQGERGMTSESYMAYALQHLKKTNQVIDDYQGKGSIAWLTGAYFPASEHVPIAYWYRGSRQADLDGDDRGYRDDSYGFRSAVGV